MKQIVIGLGMAVLMSIATMAGVSENLIVKQDQYCKRVVHDSIALHQEKDIPGLMKSRRTLRKTLGQMHQIVSSLKKEKRLRIREDYLLSVEEGIGRMDELAEEPMTQANLDQIRDICTFVIAVDEQFTEDLRAFAKEAYHASR